jgi:hypothetical protein
LCRSQGNTHCGKRRRKGNQYGWLEGLSNGLLKKMCRAARMNATPDVKRDHCTRLLGNDTVSKYAESTCETLQSCCREKSLPASGDKLEIVMSLIHSEFGTAQEAGPPTAEQSLHVSL